MTMINGKTKLVGLLGQPLEHSLSPTIHNAALNAMRINWSYVAMPCHSESLQILLNALTAINCQGLNITIPHKQAVAKLCHELTPIAQRVGAVNTLIPNKNGTWTGTNTDVEGFLSPLKDNKKEWDGLKALVLGCGGSARAVVIGLQMLNLSEIIIVGRNKDKLDLFVKDFLNHSNMHELKNRSMNVKALSEEDILFDEHIKNVDLIVNATPVGMNKSIDQNSNCDELPIKKEIWTSLNPKTILYDLIYMPRPTSWLQLGQKQGCICIDGLEMLVQQGASSLKLWTGCKEIPVQLMRKAAKTALNE